MFGRKKQATAESAGGRSRAKSVVVSGNKRRLESKTNSAPVLNSGKSLVKGILKFVSVAESLSATYGADRSERGSSENGEDEQGHRRIKLDRIEIREYERTLGDNPSCSSGPPIAISWEYYPDTIKLSIEEYEDTRPPRRSNYEMILPRDIRQSMLRKEWGVTQSQIASAVRANIKIKNQRRTTVNNLSKSTRVEEAFENATRKVMKGLLFKDTNKELDKLEKQAKEAEEQRKLFEKKENAPGAAQVA